MEARPPLNYTTKIPAKRTVAECQDPDRRVTRRAPPPRTFTPNRSRAQVPPESAAGLPRPFRSPPALAGVA